MQTRVPDGVDVVPVVFVRDEVIANLTEIRAKELAQTVATEVHALGLAGTGVRELQLDCDWTDKTRDMYFTFVRDVRAVMPGVALSSTIRLHQVKYRERTGVPPVDRGMLMFYNMGTFSADPDARVIFDAPSAAKYVQRVSTYPLPLDVALPIWSWVIQLRDDRVVDLLQSTDPDELPALDFLTRERESFRVTRTAFLHGVLLREGDVLKVEVTGPADARAAANMIAPHLPAVASPRTVTLFDLSERNLTRHGTEALDQVYRAVR
jgi:hypothetical protein